MWISSADRRFNRSMRALPFFTSHSVFFCFVLFLVSVFFFLPSSNAAITGRVQTGRRKMAAAASRKMTRAGQSITADLLLLLLLFCCCCSLSFFLLLLLLLPDSPTRFYTRRCSHSMLRRPAQISFFFFGCVSLFFIAVI